MRALRDHDDEVSVVLHAARQQSSSALSRAQEVINEWELRCMVLASFCLQVVLFFLSGFRRRYSSRVLSVVLWLAYLSADSLAVLVLGRLTLRGSGNRLALFWAPFLLLHLGGQETMTAFAMEDNALWKRHLLSLATQVPTAIYVVSKQMHGDDRWLVVPMVLVFVSGTAKYAERIWALRRAGSVAPGTSSSTSNLVSRASNDAAWITQEYYGMLRSMVSNKLERNFMRILYVAADTFKLSLHFLMDMTPSISLLPEDITEIKHGIEMFKSSEDIAYMAYKLAEVNLSLIYDYLYTKFGTRHYHRPPGCIAIQRVVSLALTSAALALFVRATAGQKGFDAADVIISYILLVGAVVLDTCSIFMSLVTSWWPYKTIISLKLKCPLCQNFPRTVAAMESIARHLNPENKGQWSATMAQYSIITACIIKEKQESGWLQRAVSWIGFGQKTVTHIGISPEVKKMLLDKLLEIVATPRVQEWDIGVGKFSGQWAQWLVETMQDHNRNAAQKVLQISNIQGLEFVSSVLLWHVVTDICSLSTDADDVDDSSAHAENANVDGSSTHAEIVDGTISSHHQDVHLDDGTPRIEDADGAISTLRGPAREDGSSAHAENTNVDGSSTTHAEISDGTISSHHEDVNGDHSSTHGARLDGGTPHTEDDADGATSALRGLARDLSGYIMYLVADCGAMAGSEGHYAVIRAKREMSRWLREKSRACDRSRVVQEIRGEDSSFFHENYYPVLDRARRVASDLRNIGDAGHRWELVAAVWLEMLCHIAHNCGAAFHAKHLTTGGEFVTHVKMLLFMLGVPFLRDVKEPLFARAGEIYS